MLDKIKLVRCTISTHYVLLLQIILVVDGYRDPSNNYGSYKTNMEMYVYTAQRLKIIVIGGRTRSPNSAIASNTVQFVDTALNIFSSRVK